MGFREYSLYIVSLWYGVSSVVIVFQKAPKRHSIRKSSVHSFGQTEYLAENDNQI